MLARADSIPRFAELTDLPSPDLTGTMATVHLGDIEPLGLCHIQDASVLVEARNSDGSVYLVHDVHIGKTRLVDLERKGHGSAPSCLWDLVVGCIDSADAERALAEAYSD